MRGKIQSETDMSASLRDLDALPASLSADHFAKPLLAWYETNARHLPWRKKWPELAPAYDVFLSELMLQQTVVATVIPYFERFKALWPTITALASSSEEDLLREWAGLGYYARARNMRKAAIAIDGAFNGDFPQSETELRQLPGIGPYTAAAIQAFAFDKPAIVLDGNVERVMSRFAGLTTPMPELKKELRVIYPKLAPQSQHADFAQAIMDLGARICISGVPRCESCPLSASCVVAGKEQAQFLPVKPKKQPKPKRQGLIFVATCNGQAVMEKRPDKGLLGAMMGFPTIGWSSKKEADTFMANNMPNPIADIAPFAANWQAQNTMISHVFTHFALDLTVYHAEVLAQDVPEPYGFYDPEAVGLASLFEKVWHSVSHR